MNYVMATLETLTEYNITPTRVFNNGTGICHFELTNSVWLLCKDDTRVTYWTDEALIAYIDFVLGEGDN